MNKALLIIVVLCLCASNCFAATKPKKEVKQGNLLYNKGEFSEALKQYEEALLRDPDSDVVNFNLGTVLYKTDDYKKSVAHFEKSLVSDDESLQQKASYNVANAKYRYGISQEEVNINNAVDLLKQSLRHYERALELDAEDDDAKYNFEFVKKELERLEQKKQQQQSQKPEGSDKEKEESQNQQSQQEQGQQQQEEPQQSQGEPLGQKDKSQKQQQEQQAKNQDAQDKDQEVSQQPGQAEEQSGQMSEEEAQMLLDSYRYEEEPKGLLKEKLPEQKQSEVLKDW